MSECVCAIVQGRADGKSFSLFDGGARAALDVAPPSSSPRRASSGLSPRPRPRFRPNSTSTFFAKMSMLLKSSTSQVRTRTESEQDGTEGGEHTAKTFACALLCDRYARTGPRRGARLLREVHPDPLDAWAHVTSALACAGGQRLRESTGLDALFLSLLDARQKEPHTPEWGRSAPPRACPDARHAARAPSRVQISRMEALAPRAQGLFFCFLLPLLPPLHHLADRPPPACHRVAPAPLRKKKTLDRPPPAARPRAPRPRSAPTGSPDPPCRRT